MYMVVKSECDEDCGSSLTIYGVFDSIEQSYDVMKKYSEGWTLYPAGNNFRNLDSYTFGDSEIYIKYITLNREIELF